MKEAVLARAIFVMNQFEDPITCCGTVGAVAGAVIGAVVGFKVGAEFSKGSSARDCFGPLVFGLLGLGGGAVAGASIGAAAGGLVVY